MTYSSQKKSFIKWVVIIARVVSGIYIFIDPLWGFVLFSVFDYFDAYMLQYGAGMSWNLYQQLDKKLDWFGYVSMLLVAQRYSVFKLLLPFFIFKLMGQIVFMVVKKQAVFLMFPNFLEAVFLWFILVAKSTNISAWVGLGVLFVFEEFKEYFLHLYWPNYLKANGFPKFFRMFGMKKQVNWG